MKTIKAKLNLGTNDYPTCAIQAGEMAEVDDAIAARMVARGHAEVVVSVAVEVQPEPKYETPKELLEKHSKAKQIQKKETV